MAKLLVAEDDFAVRDFVRRGLEMAGHEVVAVHEGQEALRRFEARGDVYDLLISDIRMAVIDGVTLARLVYKEQPQLPILFMTGYSSNLDENEFIPSVVGVINKPFTLSQIQDAVDSALSRRHGKAGSIKKRA